MATAWLKGTSAWINYFLIAQTSVRACASMYYCIILFKLCWHLLRVLGLFWALGGLKFFWAQFTVLVASPKLDKSLVRFETDSHRAMHCGSCRDAQVESGSKLPPIAVFKGQPRICSRISAVAVSLASQYLAIPTVNVLYYVVRSMRWSGYSHVVGGKSLVSFLQPTRRWEVYILHAGWIQSSFNEKKYSPQAATWDGSQALFESLTRTLINPSWTSIKAGNFNGKLIIINIRSQKGGCCTVDWGSLGECVSRVHQKHMELNWDQSMRTPATWSGSLTYSLLQFIAFTQYYWFYCNI